MKIVLGGRKHSPRTEERHKTSDVSTNSDKKTTEEP